MKRPHVSCKSSLKSTSHIRWRVFEFAKKDKHWYNGIICHKKPHSKCNMLTSCISTFYAFLVIIISLFDCGGYIQLHGCERGGILYKHCRKDCGLMPRWRQQDKKLRGMLRHFCWLLMECLLCCAAAELFFNVCPKGLICFHVRATYANAPQQLCVLTPMHLSDSSFLFPLLLIAKQKSAGLSQQCAKSAKIG